MIYISNGILFRYKREGNSVICNMDEIWASSAKWKTSDRERQILWYHLYAESKKPDLLKRLIVARGQCWGVGKMSEEDQKLQTSTYKISESWGCSIQHGSYSW